MDKEVLRRIYFDVYREVTMYNRISGTILTAKIRRELRKNKIYSRRNENYLRGFFRKVMVVDADGYLKPKKYA